MLQLEELSKALSVDMSIADRIVVLVRAADEEKAKIALKYAEAIHSNCPNSDEYCECPVQQVDNSLLDFGLEVGVDCVLYVCEKI
jgi:hypothetical protein